jgi:hypothetical protein
MDVDASHARRRLRVEDTQLPAGQIDVLAVERAQLADAESREGERRDDRPVSRLRAFGDAMVGLTSRTAPAPVASARP